MLGKLLCFIFALTQTISLVASQNYFHLLSHIKLRPEGETNEKTDFGFSIAFQNQAEPKIVVGSPHGELTGAVYSCPIKDLSYSPACHRHEFDPEKYDLYNRQDPNQNLCLGGTVVATSDYFMSCAPLWTALLDDRQGSYGTCFVHYNVTSLYRINDLLNQKKKNPPLSSKIRSVSIYGGVGWSSLVDQSNELILIGKPGGTWGDIQYINSSDPLKESKSLDFNGVGVRNDNWAFISLNPYNVGYAFASGKFFTDTNETVYAFSLQDDFYGKVAFLSYSRKEDVLYIMKNLAKREVEISDFVSGSLFGAAMFGVDVNADGNTDLLVGAPAHVSDGTIYESGAFFIYFGGDMDKISDQSRRWVVLGEIDGSRFGTALAANDLDGDALPEIFVSAPYEDDSGVLYVLSGYEINRTLIRSKTNEIYLSHLNLTQRIQMAQSKWFGFSLQVLTDIDYNGCDELAVGSPKSASAFILRCVPAINASISTKLVTKIVKETDLSFVMEVCVKITYNLRPLHISTALSATSAVIGNGAEITQPKFVINLENRETNPCRNVTVNFKHYGTGSYTFSTKLESNVDQLLQENHFETSWVRLSPYSRTEDSFQVTRYCSGDDCTPKLKLLPILFNGSDDITEYRLHSSTNSVNVTISVLNEGTTVYDASLRVRITGIKVLSIECQEDSNGYVDFYECYLPNPLLSNNTYDLNSLVDVSTNANDNVSIEASLLINRENYTQLKKEVHINFNTEDVHIIGHAYSFNIADTQLLNTTQLTIDDSHQYTLLNNGSIDWENIEVIVTVPNKDYIQQPTMSPPHGRRCTNEYKVDIAEFRCVINLPRNSSVNILLITSIVKDKIVTNLIGNKLEISSEITIIFKPTTQSAHASRTTTVFYVSDKSIGNNKSLIIALAVIGALIILAIIIGVLYRVGFFQRKEKLKLDSIKRGIERESSRRSEKKSTSDDNKPDDDFEEISMEVIEEMFQPIDCPESPDDTVLIEAKNSSKASTSQPHTQLAK